MDNEVKDFLKARLIENVDKLMRNNPVENGYCKLIDYIRELFRECFDLDIFLFVEKDVVDKYCEEAECFPINSE